eukprot:CAMPEP_0197827942 /NCGR_PEP_ID=MMETSP1437-20131217/4613_1 /TAXON_ID=49252 ORGANISM="Eucampia antarctica, Strain CCMP1452" /NCGR_SAMPLE_ID=MMETSP1437 /ASSEMBLY_ACC=CAM_ASM_001096 /LENGTH=405 /DNA_ID=CAMNT_0043428979 /DNA_START=153 /DNA_END=1370 /DNA_ORIENTATION=+
MLSSCAFSFPSFVTIKNKPVFPKELQRGLRTVVDQSISQYSSISSTSLFGGYGIAKNYTWKEEQYELDVSISVPDGTLGKDIIFKAKAKSIDLRLKGGNDDGSDLILLDGSREMRGRIDMEDTYWAISDKDSGEAGRDVILTIEKMIMPSKDQFEVVDFDWKGVYPDDEDEVIEIKYDEPEELDVKEYAASLGVDIENINMTMVDKNMFDGGLNMTKSSLDELTKEGYVKEVTQQSDGTEYIVGPDGEAVPFTPYGEGVGVEEMKSAGVKGIPFTGNNRQEGKSPIPFIDVPAPWQTSMPAEEARGVDDDDVSVQNDEDSASMVDDDSLNKQKSSDDEIETEEETSMPNENDTAVDPIDLLTVVRLKEVLRKEKIKVSGSKQELRDRLRSHVNSKIQTREGQDWQ